MKRKRTTRNSHKSSSSSPSSSSSSSSHQQQQQQQLFSETKLSIAAASLHLPNDCWESIYTFLVDGDNDNHNYIEPLSLTSKQLLSITNRLRYSFTISDPTLLFIPTLFHRFPNLTSLHITSFHGDLNSLLCQISEFPFKLKSLKISDKFQFPAKGLRHLSKKITTLTSLTCIDIISLCDDHCVLISDCFPLLEELHLQPQTISSQRIRIGVEAMLIALPKLRKVNLSGGFEHINDDSLLLYLCKNCEFLEDVAMTSIFLTPDGIAFAIFQRPTLTSISFGWTIYQVQDIISSHFIDSLVSLKGLTCLHLTRKKKISDELLSSIATGDLPLRRLVLQYCSGYSYVGIFSLLSKCQRIQHLNLQSAHFLNDHHIVTLSSFLADLVSINLSSCRKLTDSALFALVKKCSSLSDIQMERTRIGENIVENSNSSLNFGFNPQLKSLYLAQSSSVFKDESLLMFASILTNLQLLDLTNCNYISEEGICQVLRRCCKIRHLNLADCNVGKLHILNFEVPKLEVLNLSYTRVGDETLYAISKNCRGLLQLLLERCKNITKKGVMHVVDNCTQLREITLEFCYKVCADVVDNMVYSRPSLRKIIAPPHYHLSDQKRKLFWDRGCHVFSNS